MVIFCLADIVQGGGGGGEGGWWWRSSVPFVLQPIVAVHFIHGVIRCLLGCIRTQESCMIGNARNINDIFCTSLRGLPFHCQEWSMSAFPCSLARNITSHSKENLAFHSLLGWKMIILPILTTSFIHFSLKGWENVLFDLGSERVKKVATNVPFWTAPLARAWQTSVGLATPSSGIQRPP